MNIVTVFNYPDDERYNTMFKIWLLTTLKHKTESIKNIRILTRGLSAPIQKFLEWVNREDVIVVICDDVNINTLSQKAKHNIGFKLWNMCKETEPYIFVDADMVILSSFDILVKVAEEGYVIGVNHQTIPRHTEKFPFRFINTGLLVIPDPSFLIFKDILETPMRYKCPGTDQALLYNYLTTHQTTYTHHLVDYGWNSCAGYKKITEKGIWSEGLPENHKIHILHYWDEFKPWNRKCHIYDTYATYINSVDESSTVGDVLRDMPTY
jgi:lipopolysaccharide biosynthesis glycosyltransferase